MTRLEIPRRHIVFTALAVLALAAPTGGWAQSGADLSGTWVLNAELSDDPQEEFRRWAQSRGMPAPPGGSESAAGGGEGGDTYDAAGAGAGAGGPGAGLMAMMQSVSQGAERLVIEQEGDQVTITNANGQANTLQTDGKVVEREGAQGATKIKSRWKKDRMIVNVDLPQRSSPLGGMITPNIQMTYSLDKNGRLELATTVGVGAQLAPLTVERVYDREAAAPQG
jgi:hypothetical protein